MQVNNISNQNFNGLNCTKATMNTIMGYTKESLGVINSRIANKEMTRFCESQTRNLSSLISNLKKAEAAKNQTLDKIISKFLEAIETAKTSTDINLTLQAKKGIVSANIIRTDGKVSVFSQKKADIWAFIKKVNNAVLGKESDKILKY